MASITIEKKHLADKSLFLSMISALYHLPGAIIVLLFKVLLGDLDVKGYGFIQEVRKAGLLGFIPLICLKVNNFFSVLFDNRYPETFLAGVIRFFFGNPEFEYDAHSPFMLQLKAGGLLSIIPSLSIQLFGFCSSFAKKNQAHITRIFWVTLALAVITAIVGATLAIFCPGLFLAVANTSVFGVPLTLFSGVVGAALQVILAASLAALATAAAASIFLLVCSCVSSVWNYIKDKVFFGPEDFILDFELEPYKKPNISAPIEQNSEKDASPIHTSLFAKTPAFEESDNFESPKYC